jgi:hypothetical protein
MLFWVFYVIIFHIAGVICVLSLLAYLRSRREGLPATADGFEVASPAALATRREQLDLDPALAALYAQYIISPRLALAEARALLSNEGVPVWEADGAFPALLERLERARRGRFAGARRC